MLEQCKVVSQVQTQLGFLYGSAEYPIEQMTNTELWRKVQVCQHALDTIGKVLKLCHIIKELHGVWFVRNIMDILTLSIFV